MKLFYMLFLRFLLIGWIILYSSTLVQAQSSCEQITTATLQQLPSALSKNDFTQLNGLLNTLKSSCGESEFSMRLELINKMIRQENTDSLVQQYLARQYDQILIQRYDTAAEADYKNRYNQHKETFHFIPLNHTVDSLIQVKAIALLNSENYPLNKNEIALLLLFADDIEAYLAETGVAPSPDTAQGKTMERESRKNESTIGIHAGFFGAIGTNDYLGHAPIFGISFQGPLSNRFVPELMYKFRVNSNTKPFDFRYDNKTYDIESKSSHFLGVGLGYKLLDIGPYILMPKIATGYGFTWTGISETVYSENEYGEQESSIRYRNVNTLHSSIGIASIRHLARKMYIGIEANYHFIPYNWDKSLQTPLAKNYGSFELFFRF